MQQPANAGTGAPDSGAPALLAEHLSKSFGGAKALDDVALSIRGGEVHGLLGQNGSGKSTLIKVLSGFHAPEPGARLEIYGQPVQMPLGAGQFRRLGLAFVHQHLGLVASMTVLENLRIGDLASRSSGYISWDKERRRALETFKRFGLKIDPMAQVGAIPQIDRALLAIVRAFQDIRAERAHHGNPGILFLDEPTPFLPKEGVDQLFSLVRGIVADGASVVFVSHDVDEVIEITDRATVLRDGIVADTLVTADSAKDKFVETIIGSKIEPFQAEHQDLLDRTPEIEISAMTGGSVQDVSIQIHSGEVLGLTGLLGSGFSEVPYLAIGAAAATTGALRLPSGTVSLAEMTPGRALAHRIALLPADRQGAGGIGELSVTDNVTLPVLSRFRSALGLDRRRMRTATRDLGVTYDVRPNAPLMKFQDLSGGNQQKALLAKWLQTGPALLLLDEPTQGVDVGARQQVFEAIKQVADQGAAVVCASTDYEQLAVICDRVLIFARGRIVQQLVGADVTKQRIAERTLMSLSLANAA